MWCVCAGVLLVRGGSGWFHRGRAASKRVNVHEANGFDLSGGEKTFLGGFIHQPVLNSPNLPVGEFENWVLIFWVQEKVE